MKTNNITRKARRPAMAMDTESFQETHQYFGATHAFLAGKITPGPWNVDRFEDDQGAVSFRVFGGGVDGDATLIAVITHPFEHVAEEHAHAIAALPVLLQRLTA